MIDGEVRGAAGVGVIILISADHVRSVVLMAAVIRGNGPALA